MAQASYVGTDASEGQAATGRVRSNGRGRTAPVPWVAAKPKQMDVCVIPGGKPSNAAAADTTALDARQLLDRARRYRRLLSARPSGVTASDVTESLVSDLEDAIDAFCRLHQSSEAGAKKNIGRASLRERGCAHVTIPGVHVT